MLDNSRKNYFFSQRLRPCLHSCGAQNLLRLGAPINFDRCATTSCAVSPTGSAWQLCSGNPSVATVSIAHSTKRKPPCWVVSFCVFVQHIWYNVTTCLKMWPCTWKCDHHKCFKYFCLFFNFINGTISLYLIYHKFIIYLDKSHK